MSEIMWFWCLWSSARTAVATQKQLSTLSKHQKPHRTTPDLQEYSFTWWSLENQERILQERDVQEGDWNLSGVELDDEVLKQWNVIALAVGSKNLRSYRKPENKHFYIFTYTSYNVKKDYALFIIHRLNISKWVTDGQIFLLPFMLKMHLRTWENEHQDLVSSSSAVNKTKQAHFK